MFAPRVTPIPTVAWRRAMAVMAEVIGTLGEGRYKPEEGFGRPHIRSPTRSRRATSKHAGR